MAHALIIPQSRDNCRADFLYAGSRIFP
jgi:hypothetical protein